MTALPSAVGVSDPYFDFASAGHFDLSAIAIGLVYLAGRSGSVDFDPAWVAAVSYREITSPSVAAQGRAGILPAQPRPQLWRHPPARRRTSAHRDSHSRPQYRRIDLAERG